MYKILCIILMIIAATFFILSIAREYTNGMIAFGIIALYMQNEVNNKE